MVISDKNIKFIKELVNTIEEGKEDINLYLLVFNILTNKNQVKNYSSNKNGIFFNMNSVDNKTLDTLEESITSYMNSKDNLKNLEETREFILKKMGLTLNSTFKEELSEIVNTEKETYSTPLETELETYTPQKPGVSNKKMLVSLKQHSVRENNVSKKNSVYQRLSKIIAHRGCNRNVLISKDDTEDAYNIIKDNDENDENDIDIEVDSEAEPEDDMEVDNAELFGEDSD